MTKKINVRPYNNKELMLFPATIGDYLKGDDLAHVVDEAVERIDLAAYYRKISDVGNPPYHPALMIKIWFYGYATKVYSSRKIEEKLYKDVGFIYLAGMQKPDFKSISEFRRKNIEELENSFVDILQICHHLGLTKLGEIAIDSKVMKANASVTKTYDDKKLKIEQEKIKKVVEKYLEESTKTDEEEDRKYGSDKRGDELPEEIRDPEKRIEKIEQISKQLKESRKELKNSNKKKINLTDKDAQLQKDKSRTVPGYRGQIAVDGENQIIVANDVTDKQNDSSQLIPMADEMLENIDEITSKTNDETTAIKLTADGGYSSGKALVELQKEKYKDKVDPYVPDTVSEDKERGKGHNKSSPYHRKKFINNKEDNSYTCPNGNKLNYATKKKTKTATYLVYNNYKACKKCKYFGKCTTDKNGRQFLVSEYHVHIDNMRKKLSTDEGDSIYRRRKAIVEPVFGNMSYNMGFREFLLRGKRKVKGEFSLMCTAHNLLKITRFVKRQSLTLKEALSIQKLVVVP